MIDENSTFGGFLTEIGEAKQSNANALEIPWKLTHMLLGDANGTDPVPQHGQTQLINQRYRAALNQLLVDPDNPAILIAELVLPPNVGGWWIRELALEDEDGDFVAVANCAPSYKPLLAQGSGRNQVVRMHLILSNTANVQLKIDPSVVLATRDYVDTQRAEHEAGRSHPLATDTERGMVIKASQTEVNGGTDDGKFISPKKLKDWATQWVKVATETVAGMLKIATQTDVDAGTDDTKVVTPKKLRWGVSYNLGTNGYIVLPSWLGGVIIQWGYVSAFSTYGDSTIDVTFPMTFPNGVLNADWTVNRGALSQVVGTYVDNVTTSGMTLVADKNSQQTANVPAYYFALGY